MEPSIFRKSSLERAQSPERLNEYVKIMNPGIWGVLIGCLAMLVAVGFWGFYGEIPDTMTAFGTIFPEEGVTAVAPMGGGRITDVRVRPGDTVQAGQIIAVILQDELLREIDQAKNAAEPDAAYLAILMEAYDALAFVVSPVSGIVLSAASINDIASPTERVASIVRQDKYADSRQVICYIPSAQARRIREGMEVQVSPDFAPREDYGYMLGQVTSIGKYPVTQADVIAALGSEQYAQGLLMEGDCMEVRVTLAVDADAGNGIRWSNQKGESLPLSIGTDCNMQIVVDSHRPYELVFK